MSGRPDTAIHLVRAAVCAAGLGQRTDAELVRDFLDGRDASAFEALVRRHGPLVMSACRQVLRDESAAEDAFQATFVALYQKAASIRDRPSLAGWLFRVARRTATSARRADHRRAQREVATARRTTSDSPDLSWREACAALHEELDRLPDSYRLPLVLCYLQGLSRDEAARRLGWSLNEVRGRLERGRARLRARLEKRGITLSAGLLAAVGTCALPAGLVSATLASARSSGPVAASLAIMPWKAGTLLAIVATVVVGVAVQLRGVQAQPPTEPAKPAPAAAKTEPDATKATVSGRVVDPDGKPVAGAYVFVRPAGGKEPARVTVKTDAEGRFTLSVPGVPIDVITTIAATADGFAAAWGSWAGKPPGDLTLTLAKDDLPIRGRVLDLQGKPVAGASITVRAVHAFPDEGPKAYLDWLAGLRARPAHNTLIGAPPGAIAEATTGADGAFRLRGIGRDRVAQLLVTGPGIVHESIYSVTVPAIDPWPTRAGKTYPATFDHLSPPSRPIRGTARDADTGETIPGLRVNGHGGAAVTTTDSAGQYELPGYKKGPKYIVYARPADGSRYFPTMAEAADRAGLDPLEIDLKVQAGVLVSGRVVETTGKPIAGAVRYYALAGNPNVGQIPVGDFYTQDVTIRPDGMFTVAALPGPGFLAVTAKGHYPAARVDPAGFFKEGVNPQPDKDRLWINVGGGALTSVQQEGYQAIVLLNVDKGKPPTEQKIELTPAEPVRGTLLDPAGKPLAGVKVRGLQQSGDDWSEPLREAEFTGSPPHPDRPRRLVFRHDGRKLVGTAVVAAGSARPAEFRLESWSTVTGRLVDADGKPIAGVSIYAPAGKGKDGQAVDMVRIGTVFTDADGRFRIDGLLPGVAYDLNFRAIKPGGRGSLGPVTKGVGLKPGEERDLGDLKTP
jgi:RNA polymerase sigma factor (sigma-70 family)